MRSEHELLHDSFSGQQIPSGACQIQNGSEWVSVLPTHHISRSSGAQQQNSRAGPSIRPSVAEPPSPGKVVRRVPLTSGVVANDVTIAASDKFLHWCVKAQTASTRMAELDFKYLSEKNLVPRLLAAYSAIVGRRSWLTLTSCIGARFVKVNQMSLLEDLN